MRTHRALLSAVVVLSTASPPGCTTTEEVERSTSAIVGGERSDRDAVVFLFAGSTTCSAAVVGPRHVLTVAPCVTVDMAPALPSMSRVLVGADMAAAEAFTVEQIIVEAEATVDPNVNDFALVVTVDELGVTPLELSSARAAVDDPLIVAGYGQGALTSGTRQEAEVVVDMVRDDFFATPAGSPNACNGDGPALDATGALAGAALFTVGPDCPPDGVFFRDVAVYRDEVLAWIAEVDTDAGVDPDAGAPDAAMDAGAVDAGAPDASSGGGGGGCSAAGTSAGWGVLTFLLFVRRRQMC